MKNQLSYKNKKFRIMLVGDPHEKAYSDHKDRLDKIKDYLLFQTEAVKTLKPDLVVLMGDNASGKTPEAIREVLLRITAPYKNADIPFTFILGNHDLESPVSELKTQYEIYRSLPGIIFPAEYSENGDYHIPVYATDNSVPVLDLWYFYNGSHPDRKYHSHYSAVDENQIQWFEKETDKIKAAYGTVPGIVFQHVPVAEEFALLNKKTPFSMLFDGVTGQDGHYGNYYTLKKTTSGYMGEAPCTADYNKGQFDSWKKCGNIFAAFFGHDHMNDLIGMNNGILLGQCKTASFTVYGDGMMQGVRIIDLVEDAPFTLNTKMVYYRDIIGNECRSLHGRERDLRDRTSVKIDKVTQFSKVAVPVITAFSAIKILSER